MVKQVFHICTENGEGQLKKHPESNPRLFVLEKMMAVETMMVVVKMIDGGDVKSFELVLSGWWW